MKLKNWHTPAASGRARVDVLGGLSTSSSTGNGHWDGSQTVRDGSISITLKDQDLDSRRTSVLEMTPDEAQELTTKLLGHLAWLGEQGIGPVAMEIAPTPVEDTWPAGSVDVIRNENWTWKQIAERTGVHLVTAQKWGGKNPVEPSTMAKLRLSEIATELEITIPTK